MQLNYKILKHYSSNIVYIPTLKVASTYFTRHLLNCGFEETHHSDINSSDLLLSHIMHPLVRRNKGIAQFFSNMPGDYLSQAVNNESDLLQILQAPYFDEHSAPLTLLYEDFIDRIYFIPIDVAQIDYLAVTSAFFKKHGIHLDFSSQRIHVSDSRKTHMFNIIDANLKSAITYSDLIPATFRKDIELYTNIVNSFISEPNL